MKVLVDSFNNVIQNPAGGVQMRIKKIHSYISNKGIEMKLFNKWEDEIENFDILHIFKITVDSYNLCMLAKRKGLKIVISSVIPPIEEFKVKTMLKLPINTCQDLIRRSLILADKIICQTNKEANYIEKVYKINKEKIIVIPNGVDKRFKICDENIFRKKFNIKGDFLLQVGRFDNNKNQLNVIKALKNTNVQVVFIGGTDPGAEEYYKECRKIANSNMHFIGWVTNDNDILASAYKAAKVTILPSLSEIFGNSLIEGGMAGCNLIATNTLPIEEWGIESKCIKVDPKNIEEIKSSILKSMNMKKNNEISKIIEAKFSWDKVSDDYIKIYKEALK